jgi:phenylpropionate dioxygenase-like ring-hydroxylating dioxygenase large terminal subunit
MAATSRILNLPPYPKSWYAVALSADLKPGDIKELMFCGQETVLYRTTAGKAVLAEAFCPHMGAHLAHGGKIDGESIQCPFHGFCFDSTGKCVKTGYGTKPPPQAILKTWPVHEVNGVIMVWHDENDAAPDWNVPTLEWAGWSETKFADWRLASHPQEIAENSADIGHFRHVHGYDDVKVFEEARTEGPVLFGKYGMSRIASFVGNGGSRVHAEFNFYEYGLGMAYVEAFVPKYGLQSRHFVYPMPIDGKDVQLRIAVIVKQDFDPGKINPLLRIVPKKLLMYFILGGYYREYKRDVSDDFKVWQNKVYVHPPALAQGDGPVVLYRKWAAQFYK